MVGEGPPAGNWIDFALSAADASQLLPPACLHPPPRPVHLRLTLCLTVMFVSYFLLAWGAAMVLPTPGNSQLRPQFERVFVLQLSPKSTTPATRRRPCNGATTRHGTTTTAISFVDMSVTGVRPPQPDTGKQHAGSGRCR